MPSFSSTQSFVPLDRSTSTSILWYAPISGISSISKHRAKITNFDHLPYWPLLGLRAVLRRLGHSSSHLTHQVDYISSREGTLAFSDPVANQHLSNCYIIPSKCRQYNNSRTLSVMVRVSPSHSLPASDVTVWLACSCQSLGVFRPLFFCTSMWCMLRLVLVPTFVPFIIMMLGFSFSLAKYVGKYPIIPC